MVPATNTCHPGWTVEYTGYLMAGKDDHAAGTEFICMDTLRRGRIGSNSDHNGKLFYYVLSKCGSLPCPPYEDGKVLIQQPTKWNAYLYGAEYDTRPEAEDNFDVVCAVCEIPRPLIIMVPATNTCHPGWTMEYTGHLMAGYPDHASATEFVCMDSVKEVRFDLDVLRSGLSRLDTEMKEKVSTVSIASGNECPENQTNHQLVKGYTNTVNRKIDNSNSVACKEHRQEMTARRPYVITDRKSEVRCSHDVPTMYARAPYVLRKADARPGAVVTTRS
nr:hypothetical protein BaRGS_028681 [Batillaria attramentaria]